MKDNTAHSEGPAFAKMSSIGVFTELPIDDRWYHPPKAHLDIPEWMAGSDDLRSQWEQGIRTALSQALIDFKLNVALDSNQAELVFSHYVGEDRDGVVTSISPGFDEYCKKGGEAMLPRFSAPLPYHMRQEAAQRAAEAVLESSKA